jgi:hypothetical protein
VYDDRWADQLAKRDWDSTEQPLLRWEEAPIAQQLPGQGTAFFQMVLADTVVETVTVLPKPYTDSATAVFDDKGNVSDDARKMWVHTVGYSSHGET